jgi:hypothetical protein
MDINEQLDDLMAETPSPDYTPRYVVLFDLADGTSVSVKDDAAGVHVSVQRRYSSDVASFTLTGNLEAYTFTGAIDAAAAISRNRVDPI